MKRSIRLVIDLSSRYSKNPYVDFFIMAAINVLLSTALLGNLRFVRYQSFGDFVLFGFLVAVIDSMFRDTMMQRYPRFVMSTFGTVMIIPAVISLSLVYLILSETLIFSSTEVFLGFIVLYLFLRKIISYTLLFQIHRLAWSRRRKKKEIKDAQL
jgi:small-conductance mechanosensitive channel